MPSIKVKFRPSSRAAQPGTIYYQVIHLRKVGRIPTDYHIFPDEWDEEESAVVPRHGSGRESILQSIRERVNLDLSRLRRICRAIEQEDHSFTIKELTNRFRDFSDECSLFNFMERIICRMRENGKIRTAETYTSTLRSFRTFRNDVDITLDCINSELLEAFEAWHHRRGNTPNTVSFYMRILRATYKRAVEDGKIKDRHPFRRVYTGVEKTTKRALPLSVIKKIHDLDLSATPRLEFAHDIFMLSFMMRGMSFVDMAFLRKSDVHNGVITYRRRKTGQQLSIRLTTMMKDIINKYPDNGSEYLLPIITPDEKDPRTAYRNAGYRINNALKKIADILKLPIPLTLYVARHSWASAAKTKGIPLSVISEGMGHDSENTTRIYLASLDTAVIDRANNIILKSLE